MWILLASVIGLSVVMYLMRNSQKSQPMSYLELVDFAKTHSNLSEVLDAAARSNYTKVQVMLTDGKAPPALDPNGLPNKDWMEWRAKNMREASISPRGPLKDILKEMPKGVLQLWKPKDSPMSYDRSFLQIRFDGNRVLEVEARSL